MTKQNSRRGATALEWTLVLVGIGVAALAAVFAFDINPLTLLE